MYNKSKILFLNNLVYFLKTTLPVICVMAVIVLPGILEIREMLLVIPVHDSGYDVHVGFMGWTPVLDSSDLSQ